MLDERNISDLWPWPLVFVPSEKSGVIWPRKRKTIAPDLMRTSLSVSWGKLHGISLILHNIDKNNVNCMFSGVVLYAHMLINNCFCLSRTFTHNMVAFGLSKKLCNDFLKKQAVIGNLNEGNVTFQLSIPNLQKNNYIYRFVTLQYRSKKKCC